MNVIVLDRHIVKPCSCRYCCVQCVCVCMCVVRTVLLLACLIVCWLDILCSTFVEPCDTDISVYAGSAVTSTINTIIIYLCSSGRFVLD